MIDFFFGMLFGVVMTTLTIMLIIENKKGEKEMKTEDEIKSIYGQVISNAVRSDSMEQLRFYQGQINILEALLGLNQDAFTEENKVG